MKHYEIGRHDDHVLLDAYVEWATDQFSEIIQRDGDRVLLLSVQTPFILDTLSALFTGFVGGWEAK